MDTVPNRVWWILRVGAAACFIGHGAFGVITKAAWLPFFALVGIGPELAYKMMPVIGTVDILVGISILIRPIPVVLMYMTMWSVWTAALRPLTGDHFAEMLERAGNYGVPLALLFMIQWPTTLRGWLSPARRREIAESTFRSIAVTLVLTTSVLLLGHGLLGIAGKPLLSAHYAALGVAGASLAPTIGGLEVLLALMVVAFPSRALIAGVLAWKLASESLFVVAGDPVWEFVERAGSYAAPLTLLVLSFYYCLPRITFDRLVPARVA